MNVGVYEIAWGRFLRLQKERIRRDRGQCTQMMVRHLVTVFPPSRCEISRHEIPPDSCPEVAMGEAFGDGVDRKD